MSIRTAAMAAIAIGTLSVSACATTEGIAQYEDELANRTSTVRVSNNNWSEVTIYLVRPGMRARLGSVSSMSTADLRIPRALMTPGSNIQLVARPLASNRGYVSQNIHIMPGQRINLRVENSINLSSYSIR